MLLEIRVVLIGKQIAKQQQGLVAVLVPKSCCQLIKLGSNVRFHLGADDTIKSLIGFLALGRLWLGDVRQHVPCLSNATRDELQFIQEGSVLGSSSTRNVTVVERKQTIIICSLHQVSEDNIG